MAILPIVIAPDARLKQKSSPVDTVTDDIRTLIEDMFDTMYDAGGIGLAAVQVGVHKRILVMDIEQEERGLPKAPLVLINPEIVESTAELSVYNEGCLSFPDQYSDVERPKEVRVRYLDKTGAAQEMFATGLLATCVQHEMDHLNGIVFVDHISRMKKDIIMRKLKKAAKRDCGHDHVHGEHCDH